MNCEECHAGAYAECQDCVDSMRAKIAESEQHATQELKIMLSEQQSILERCKADRGKVITHGNGQETGGVITPREVDTYPRIDILKSAIARIEQNQ